MKYKRLMSILLRECFDETIQTDNLMICSYEYINEIVCRYALKSGYVSLNENKYWLTEKGKKLIGE